LSLPSWVPDWTRPTSLGYVVYPCPSTTFTASRGTDLSEFSFDRDCKELSVRAVVFDITTGITAYHDEELSFSRATEDGAMYRMGFGYLRELAMLELCRASKGHLVFVHEAARAGDEIVIVHGERVPFVLRRAGVKRRLIGCAFFSDIMAGQGLNPSSEHYVGGSTRTLTLV
jgi:hypothetical protein